MKKYIIVFALYLTVSNQVVSVMPHHGGQITESKDVIAQGGRIYDKWWVELKLDKPTMTHPLYPVNGKKKGATTWRCKECHGWDYRGNKGAYKSGSHYTGIVGIRSFQGESIEAVLNIISNKQHQFDSVIANADLKKLARFVVAGQVDMEKFIDYRTSEVNGNKHNGRKIYSDNCRQCHGRSGKSMNFSGDDATPEYVGTVAVHNPWEALHKILNGHPGAIMDRERVRKSGHMMMHMQENKPMPSMRKKLSEQEQVDLLSYMQTLPVK